MARKPTTEAKSIAATPPKSAGDASRAEQAALVVNEKELAEIEKRFGDGAPFDEFVCLARIDSSRTIAGSALFEMGGQLIRLKANVPGRFHKHLQERGIEPRVAQRLMQSARKFSHSDATKALASRLSQSKVLELLTLDDDKLEEIALDPDTVDEFEEMSVTELRAAARKLKHDQSEDAEKYQAKLAAERKKNRSWAGELDEKTGVALADFEAEMRKARNAIAQANKILTALGEAYADDKAELPDETREILNAGFSGVQESLDELQQAI